MRAYLSPPSPPFINLNCKSLTKNSCICVDDQYSLPQTLQHHVEEPEFNTDFSSWLPRYQKPAHPCEYCRSRSLECFIYNANGEKDARNSGCSPCNALFRPCSFSNPERMPMLRSRTAVDTLDRVPEGNAHLIGGSIGKKPMRSLGHVGDTRDGLLLSNGNDAASKRGAGAARFPRAAVKILKDWLIEHIDHPYPSEEEKEALKVETGLSVGQISNWMANTRRRQKARPKRSASPSIRPSTEAMNIPAGTTWELMSAYFPFFIMTSRSYPKPSSITPQFLLDFIVFCGYLMLFQPFKCIRIC